MQRHPARRSHLLTTMGLSLVAVGAMCVFVAATAGLRIQTGSLDIQIGPDNGSQIVIGTGSSEALQAETSSEVSASDETATPLDLVDQATDLVDQATCPTESVCVSSVVKDTGIGEIVEEATDGIAGSALGEPLGETVEDTVDEVTEADTLGDAIDEVVEGVDEVTEDLVDEVEDIVEDLGDEVEDAVGGVLGGLGLGD